MCVATLHCGGIDLDMEALKSYSGSVINSLYDVRQVALLL